MARVSDNYVDMTFLGFKKKKVEPCFFHSTTFPDLSLHAIRTSLFYHLFYHQYDLGHRGISRGGQHLLLSLNLIKISDLRQKIRPTAAPPSCTACPSQAAPSQR